MIISTLACAFQSCIGQLWGKDDFSDFCIIVENKYYRCHRFVLRACSQFFDGLLRSDMKETREACTKLPGITADIFDIVMNFLYRGSGRLTQANVVSVWKVVHQLQIDYLIKACEDFVMRTMSIDTYTDYYICANLLESKQVIQLSRDFMINNFNHFRDTDTFLELTAEELCMIVGSHNLNIKFKELAVESILQWVIHVPTFCSESETVVSHNANKKQRLSVDSENNGNKEKCLTDNSSWNRMDNIAANGTEDTIYTDRVKELGGLLRAARLCFLRLDFLQDLLIHPVISTNKEALAELQKAYFYQQKAHQDYCPSTAVHEACSDMTHGMVYVDGLTRHCKMYSLDTGSTHVLCQLPTGYKSWSMSLGVSDQMLFLNEASWDLRWKNHICIWEKVLGWTKYTVAKDGCLDKLLPHGDKFYMIYRNAKKTYQFQMGNILFDTHTSNFIVYAAVSCKRYILTMEEADIEFDKTAVKCYDSVTKETTRLQDWDGPPNNTISFRFEDNIYILQGNGTLRQVISIDDEDNGYNDENDNDEEEEEDNDNYDKVRFKLIAKLWDFAWKPYGAVVYKGELIIFGSETDDSVTWMTSVPGISYFKNIKFIQMYSSSQCHPIIVPKSWLN